jgi:hypothetical protein
MQCLDQDGKIACKSGRVRIAGYLAMNKTAVHGILLHKPRITHRAVLRRIKRVPKKYP